MAFTAQCLHKYVPWGIGKKF